MAKKLSASDSYHHGALRDALIAAGRRLLEQKGVAGLTLREAARAAGVSAAAPYRHFKDKADLLAAVATEGFVEFGAAQMAAGADAEAPFEVTLNMAVAYVEFAIANPELFTLMFGRERADKESFPDLAAAADASYLPIMTAIAQCQGRGDAVGDGRDPATLSAWAIVHGLANLIISGQLDVSGLSAQQRDTLIRGIVARLDIASPS